MTATDDHGALHAFNISTSSWSILSPTDPSAPYPEARSYHTLTTDGIDTLYLHAGCPAAGRLSDLWSFNVTSRTWRQLKNAPEPARGGTSIAFSQGTVWRMNGFDGKTEQGGFLDCYDPGADGWTSLEFPADGKAGPEARSVGVLLPVEVGGREMLVTMFGERDPSSLGHQGAGRMLDDVWGFDLGEKAWRKVEVEGERPEGRGWFDGGVVNNEETVVQGGLNEGNERLGDVWVLRLS
jgi:hypothetical protein